MINHKIIEVTNETDYSLKTLNSLEWQYIRRQSAPHSIDYCDIFNAIGTNVYKTIWNDGATYYFEV